MRAYILENDSGASVLSTIKKYTIGLPGLLFARSNNEMTIARVLYLTISEEDRDLFAYLDGALTIEVDEKEGLGFPSC